jgi:hypothetical protein
MKAVAFPIRDEVRDSENPERTPESEMESRLLRKPFHIAILLLFEARSQPCVLKIIIELEYESELAARRFVNIVVAEDLIVGCSGL